MDEHLCRAYTDLSFSVVVDRVYDPADRYFPAGLAFSTARDLDSWTDYMPARMLLDRGRWTEAADLAERVMRSSPLPIQRIALLVVLGLLRIRRGDPGAKRVAVKLRRDLR